MQKFGVIVMNPDKSTVFIYRDRPRGSDRQVQLPDHTELIPEGVIAIQAAAVDIDGDSDIYCGNYPQVKKLLDDIELSSVVANSP